MAFLNITSISTHINLICSFTSIRFLFDWLGKELFDMATPFLCTNIL